MRGHVEREGRRDNGMELTRGARFHNTIFVVGEGATDVYGHGLSARAAAEKMAALLTSQDGKARRVENIGEWESYVAVDPVTNQPLSKVHGVDDGYGHA